MGEPQALAAHLQGSKQGLTACVCDLCMCVCMCHECVCLCVLRDMWLGGCCLLCMQGLAGTALVAGANAVLQLCKHALRRTVQQCREPGFSAGMLCAGPCSRAEGCAAVQTRWSAGGRQSTNKHSAALAGGQPHTTSTQHLSKHTRAHKLTCHTQVYTHNTSTCLRADAGPGGGGVTAAGRAGQPSQG